MQTLAGRTCLIAGGSGGDGVDIVKALLKGGMNVVMMTHQAAQAQALLEELESEGYPGKCTAVEGKTGPAEKDPEIMAALEKEWGSIDVIIANTGADGKRDDIETVSEEELINSIAHLAGGSFSMMQTALPFLKKSRAPRVIFMTTVEGENGGTHESFVNAVAKGAVRSLIVNSAARLARFGITVNGISKGAIPRTAGHIDPDSPKPEEILDKIPLGGIGSPKDLAEAVCFLASEESSFVTGEIINVAGGLQLG